MSERIVKYKFNLYNGDKVYIDEYWSKDIEIYYVIENNVAIRKRFNYFNECSYLIASHRFDLYYGLCKQYNLKSINIDYHKLCQDDTYYEEDLQKDIIRAICKSVGIKIIEDCYIVSYATKRVKGFRYTRLHLGDVKHKLEHLIRNGIEDGLCIYDIWNEAIRQISEKERERMLQKNENKQNIIKDINRFVTRIDTPTYERETGNCNKNTFDFIRIYVDLPSNEILDKNLIKEGLNIHYKTLCSMVLNKISNMKNYQRFGVPVTALKLSKAVVEYRHNRVMFIFELKDELRKIMQEQG